MKEKIKKAVSMLESGRTILYPTDTIWGIGCDATQSKAVEKIYKLKHREKIKGFIILVNSIKMISQYVENPPEAAFDLIASIDHPLTIIYPKSKNLPSNVSAPDGSIGIRIVSNNLCATLIEMLQKPIISTSANFSGQDNPLAFSKIDPKIIESVDYVLDLETKKIENIKPSMIIKLVGETEFEILRD